MTDIQLFDWMAAQWIVTIRRYAEAFDVRIQGEHTVSVSGYPTIRAALEAARYEMLRAVHSKESA